MQPSPVVLKPRAPAEFTVIWLHGLGADGNDFVPIVAELGLAETPAVKFIFPQAAVLPVTINGGMTMSAWYDIAEANLSRSVDEAGIDKSVAYIKGLVQEEVDAGIPPDHIILAGFSQGGVIAYRVGLEMKLPLLGIMALSTYLPIHKDTDNTGLNIFIGHGRLDDVAPLRIAMNARSHLIGKGHTVEWHDYEMGHSVNASEIADIANWLQARFAN